METRQAQLLKTIIETYIETAEPIGSKFLVDHGEFHVSGATLRNEMRELEEMGYLAQPHTSAGRIPTEQGYQYYARHMMDVGRPAKQVQADIGKIAKGETAKDIQFKTLAKYTAETAGNVVIMSLNRHTVYYTGISLMLSQPEFRDYAYTIRMSALFDHCEDVIPVVDGLLHPSTPRVFIGSENPFGNSFGTVAARLAGGMFAIVGPLRMDYREASGILQYIHDTF